MAEAMLQLGDYQFSIDTAAYQSFSRNSEYRWVRQPRLGNHDALQFTGYGPDTIELTGVIYPGFKGGLGQLSQMNDEAEKKRARVLVSGLGKFMGVWVIESVGEGQTVFLPGGVPQKQEFRMRLSRYDQSFFALPF